jgi:thioesterase domain-containing protein
MAQVERALGRRLPVATLFRAPTVEGLAAQLRAGALPWSPLVPIRPAGAGTPLFCVHPIGGTVFCYRELAGALGPGRPLYGLQAQGLDGVAVPLEHVEDMASNYLRAVRGVQGRGPYLLAGWSFGGLVAFEMARQLEEDGEAVALLALIDSRAPGDATYREATPADFELELARQARPDAAGFPAASPPVDRSALERVFAANGRAGHRYRPSGYTRPVLLLSAADTGPRPAGALVAGWRRLLGDGLEAVPVPGSHHTLLQAPHVHSLGALLEGRLAAAARS